MIITRNDGTQTDITGHIPIQCHCPFCFSDECYHIGWPPKDEKGHWIWDKDIVICSFCKWEGYYCEVVETIEEHINYKRGKIIGEIFK